MSSGDVTLDLVAYQALLKLVLWYKVWSAVMSSEPGFELEKSEEDIAWEKQRNVTIQLAQESDYDEMKQFLAENFYDDDPVTRSLGIHKLDGYFARKLNEYDENIMIANPLKKQATLPACIVARSNETGKIVASRFGDIKKKSEVKNEPDISWLSDLPTWVPIPTVLQKAANFMYLMLQMPYNPSKAFDELKCETIYTGIHVCVGREARGKGLGVKLVEVSHRLAERAGCEYSYIFSSGKYSQAIFKKLGYRIAHEKPYADFEHDRRGRPFLNNHGEHTVLQVVTFEHPKEF